MRRLPSTVTFESHSAQNSTRVLSLTDIDVAQEPVVGGKAASLGRLSKQGFRIPEGFVFTTQAFQDHLSSLGIWNDVQAIFRGVSENPSEEKLQSLRQKVLSAPLLRSVEQSLLRAHEDHFDTTAPLAVRSSGTHEDTEGASFAGLYETFLNIQGPLALVAAVKKCWASVLQPRVVQYFKAKARSTTDVGMAVVVQRLIPAQVSGVLFSVNPITGRERETVVEATFGLGEALVSGKVNADRFVVDAPTGTVVSQHIAEKAFRSIPSDRGGTHEQPLSPQDARRPTLKDAQLQALVETGNRIQEEAGQPVDVEWVFDNNILYVVQSRPITRIQFAPDYGEWTTADLKDGGVSASVCSPFMWSLYEICLNQSFPTYFKDIKLLARDYSATWANLYFARPYWNLGEVKKVLQKIPGFHERNFDADLGVAITYEGSGRTTPVTFGGIVRALPVLFALEAHYEGQLKKDQAFVDTFARAKAPYALSPEALAELDDATFVERYRTLIQSFYRETETTYFTTIYNTSNANLDFKVDFEKAKKACQGDLDFLKLVSGLENLSHLRPMVDLHQVLLGIQQRGETHVSDAAVKSFAERWPYHGKKVLDIREPRWRDDLAHVRSLLEQSWSSFDAAEDPTLKARHQHAEYLAEVEKVRRAFRWRPWAWRRFQKRLNRVRQYAWWREEMRDHSEQLYDLIRTWSVEAGRRLVAQDQLETCEDLWYVSFQDAVAAVEGSLSGDALTDKVSHGRRMVRSFRSFKNPTEIGHRYAFDGGHAGAAPSHGALRGIPSSGGRLEGRAKVVRSLDDSHKLEKGDILVATFTDPGWTPLFATIGAVVTETGGLLSHAAVISREYGIPAVLAVSGATSAIRDGDTVVVDGTLGVVEVRGQSSSS